jgi:amino acid adenylation domain-containing protein
MRSTDLLNQRLAQLSPEKRALLEAQILKKQQKPASSQIPKRSQQSPCALSFAQQRLWFLAQLQPDSASYNIPIALHFPSELDLSALQQALNAIVERHEVLRTTFDLIADEPVQVIQLPRPVNLVIIDLERKSELQRSLTQAAQQSFDLRQDLMLKATLFRLPDGEQALLLLLHHIASDGWSGDILLREIDAYYTAFTTGNPISLPALPIQYADFSQWQRQWLSGDVLTQQLDDWKQRLAGELPVLELSNSFAKATTPTCSTVQTDAGERHSLTLSKTLTQAIQQFAQQEKVTLFMMLLAAFKTLLYRYTQQEDMLIGSAIANRKWAEVEGLIGFFVNTLVLRTDLSGQPTFRSLLHQVREVVLSAYEHQDLPFEKLVEELQPERRLHQNPLVQVMFVLHNASDSAPTFANSTPILIDTETAKFDLVLSCTESTQGLKVSWSYRTEIFERSTIEQMSQHFEVLLNGIIAEPDQSIATLPILTPSEKQQFLDWNQTHTDYPRTTCIHQQFEAQAEQTPDAIALVMHDQQYSYHELNQQANQLAHYLRTLGVRPNQAIAVYLQRSPKLIIALLAILKAGGAYLPLDPTYPFDRLSYMLEDTQATILLHETVSVFPAAFSNCQVINLDTLQLEQTLENLAPVNTPLDLAYILYTSGSTGTPKGVMVPHRAVMHLVLNTNYIDLQAVDVIAQVSNCSFDAATFEIWGALLNGATLAIVPKAVLLSPNELAAALRSHSIRVLFLTTALFHQLAQHVPTAFQTLRYLLVGGEVTDSHWVNQVLECGAPEHFLHVYGPTENTTFSSWYRVEHISSTLPIGRPIANTQIFLLDRHLQPVPVGVSGEICLGGDGLALGYLNRPDTSQFVSTQIDGVPVQLYRTGDRARYLPDGNLDFLGRFDHQIKLRGFRIELGEIEAALRQHPDVQDAIVLIEQTDTQDKSLQAYLTSTQAISSRALRQFLQQTLPDYMLPKAFHVLETFPLTPNGKVDRAKLCNFKSSESLSELANPNLVTSPLETQLLQIWQTVSGMQLLSTDDNFFEIGGHSLLAVRLQSAIEQLIGRKLPLFTVFQAPTVKQMAQRLEQEQIRLDAAQNQLRSLFWYSQHPGEVAALTRHLEADQPLIYLDSGLLEVLEPTEHIRDRAKLCLAEIKRLQPQGPYLLGGFCMGGLVAFETALQLQAQGEEIAFLALAESWLASQMQRPKPHPLSKPPVIRTLYFHSQKLVSLKPSDRLDYIATQINRVPSLGTRLLAWIKRVFKPESPVQEAQREWMMRGGQAVHSYIPPRAYSGRIYFYFSQVGDESQSLIEQAGWKKFVSEQIEVEVFAGNHHSIMREPDVQGLAKAIKATIDSLDLT